MSVYVEIELQEATNCKMCLLMINKDDPRPGGWKLEDSVVWPSVLVYSVFAEILRN